MIQLTAVQKKLGGQLIIDIPSFTLDDGIYWIQGVNGSGKTTLLKILSGMIPFSGDISITDTSLKKQPLAYRKLISYAEAEPVYPAFLSGKEIIDMYVSVKKEKRQVVDELIDAFHAGYYISAQTGTYSSGMLKKLSLTLAFIGTPKVILLDEPLVTLDAESIATIHQLVKEYHRIYGTVFLMTSHQDFPDAASLIKTKLLIENKTLHFS